MALSPFVLTSCQPENAKIPQKKVLAVELNLTITPFIEFQRDFKHRERIVQYLLEHQFKNSGITAVCDKRDILLRFSSSVPAKQIMVFLAYTSIFESLARKMENDSISCPEDRENPATPILPLSKDVIEFVMSGYDELSDAKNNSEISRQFPLIKKGEISQYADDKSTYFSNLSMNLTIFKKDKLVALDFKFLPEGYFSDYGVNFHQATSNIIDNQYIIKLSEDMNTEEKRKYYLTAIYESSQVKTIRQRISAKNKKSVNYLTDPIVVPTSSSPAPDLTIPINATDPVTPDEAAEIPPLVAEPVTTPTTPDPDPDPDPTPTPTPPKQPAGRTSTEPSLSAPF